MTLTAAPIRPSKVDPAVVAYAEHRWPRVWERALSEGYAGAFAPGRYGQDRVRDMVGTTVLADLDDWIDFRKVERDLEHSQDIAIVVSGRQHHVIEGVWESDQEEAGLGLGDVG